jgi:D-sedoheptulose 7-phosphate isomerase
MDAAIRKAFEEHAALAAAAQKHLAPRIAQAAELILAAYRDGKGVFLFGNGGSAADAQHIAAELVGRFLRTRRAFRAQALSTNTSILTAVANDDAFEKIFVRQLEANAGPGDVAFALSTSGDSPNVVEALRYAREHGLRTIALTGQGGGQCEALADVLLDVPSAHTPRVQEIGTLVYHLLCQLVEDDLAG